MQRQPIKLSEGVSAKGYIADTYVAVKPNKTQRYLAPYLIPQRDLSICYFPTNSFSKREENLHLTRTVMDTCVENQVPMMVESRTLIPDWAIEKLKAVRGSLVIFQVPSLNPSMKRRFFKTTHDTPEDIRVQAPQLFQLGINVRLKFTPIIPTVFDLGESMEYMNSIRSILKGVDIVFGRLTEKEIRFIERRNRLKKDTLRSLYTKDEFGHYYLEEEIQDDIAETIEFFCDGNKIPVGYD